MSLKPITAALGGLMPAVYESMLSEKKPKPPIGPAPMAIDGTVDATGKKRRAYRPAAQLFKDDDLRLGSAGKLGM